MGSCCGRFHPLIVSLLTWGVPPLRPGGQASRVGRGTLYITVVRGSMDRLIHIVNELLEDPAFGLLAFLIVLILRLRAWEWIPKRKPKPKPPTTGAAGA